MTSTRWLGLAAAVAATLTAALAMMAAPACARVKWNLPTAYPADNFHSENLEAFANELTQATSGKLVIRVYPNASLLPASAIKSAVRIGQAQMGEILISAARQ
jgi:TRAP-type C4-dicarboxylate transport system substrate-binding protein